MTDLAVVTLSADDARKLTERIRYTALSVRDGMEKLQRLVQEAKDGNAHEALGYASWTAYLADTLGAEPLRLPRDQRQELVGYLAGEGMSSRAIAPIVGASRRTVDGDIQQVGISAHVESEPDYVTDEADPIVNRETGEIFDAPASRKVTGLDGKSYSRPEPRATPRRTPLPDEARTAGWALRTAVDRLQAIGADDRFNAHKEAVAPHLRSHLTNAIEVCQDLLDRIDNN